MGLRSCAGFLLRLSSRSLSRPRLAGAAAFLGVDQAHDALLLAQPRGVDAASGPPSDRRCRVSTCSRITFMRSRCSPSSITSARWITWPMAWEFVGVDDQRFPKSSREAPAKAEQNQHAVLVVARGDELLGDEVHAVVQGGDDAQGPPPRNSSKTSSGSWWRASSVIGSTPVAAVAGVECRRRSASASACRVL